MKGDRVEAVVEHPAHEGSAEKPVDVSTRRRMGAGTDG